MGSCISGNGSIYIVKKKQIKQNKKAAGCLSSLCKGEDDLYIENKNFSEIVPIPQIQSSFNFFHEDNKLNTDLNNIISKYKEKLKIQKINFEQIYNIFMNYTYDFTKSNFIICDSREMSKEKTQLFIKKFPHINYNIKQLEVMKKEKINKFFKFLNHKNIIFILKDESSLDLLEKYVIFFLANEGSVFLESIFILSQYIKKYDETNTSNNYMDYLYYFIDEDVIYAHPPKILINSNDINSSMINYKKPNSNNSYVFVDTFPHINNEYKSNIKNTKIMNKFDINYLSNKNTLENDLFLNFISKFNINYIMNFFSVNEIKNDINITAKNSNYIIHKGEKRNKANNEDKKPFIKEKKIYIPKSMDFNDFYKIIHNELIPLIEELKEQIIQNNCILIQFDNNIENLFKLKLIYIIIFRITGLTFDNIFNYLEHNFFELENETSIQAKKEEILNFLI